MSFLFIDSVHYIIFMAYKGETYKFIRYYTVFFFKYEGVYSVVQFILL